MKSVFIGSVNFRLLTILDIVNKILYIMFILIASIVQIVSFPYIQVVFYSTNTAGTVVITYHITSTEMFTIFSLVSLFELF